MSHSKQNYLFLDIDGVLNTRSSLREQIRKYGKGSRFVWCPKACRNIEQLIDEFEARIIITSTWKYEFSLAELKELFQKNNIKASNVMGVTSSLIDQGRVTRGQEIEKWIRLNRAENDLNIVIDDNDDDLSGRFEHFLRCNPETGFAQKEIYEQCVRWLREWV